MEEIGHIILFRSCVPYYKIESDIRHSWLNEAEIDTLMILFLIVGNIWKIAAGILADKKKNLKI